MTRQLTLTDDEWVAVCEALAGYLGECPSGTEPPAMVALLARMDTIGAPERMACPCCTAALPPERAGLCGRCSVRGCRLGKYQACGAERGQTGRVL